MENRVILILIDGMRPDALAGNAAAEAFLRTSRKTLSGQTVMPSVTLPTHMSLFHSVEPGRHGILTNLYTPQVRPIKGLCERLDESGKTSALFYDWEQLRDLTRPGSVAHAGFVSGHAVGYERSDPMVTRMARACWLEQKPDFLFLYLGQVDEIGHRDGWMSDGYRAAIDRSWEQVEAMLDGLDDSCTILITADHGGHDRMHGTEDPQDMSIPIMIRQPGRGGGDLPAEASILDLAPTIAALLGVDPDPEWEGKSLIDTESTAVNR